MLEFDQEFLEFKFSGKVHKLRIPSVKDVQKMMNESKKEGVSEIDAQLEFLKTLGLCDDVAEKLSVNQLITLLDAMREKKTL